MLVRGTVRSPTRILGFASFPEDGSLDPHPLTRAGMTASYGMGETSVSTGGCCVPAGVRKVLKGEMVTGDHVQVRSFGLPSSRGWSSR
jgi:hypothetical protein